MTEHKSVRWRRLAAFLIDMHLSLYLAFFPALLGTLLPPGIALYYILFCCLFFMGHLYVRDWLLNGRSIGKRICGLSVVDFNTGLPCTGKQLLLKGLSYVICSVDALVLLVTGRSIGEYISRTAVIAQKRPAPLVKKRLVKFIAVVAVLALIVGFVINFALYQAGKNESCALAQAYLTESETFAAQEQADAHISLVGFSLRTVNGEQTHQYSFQTRSHTYEVTCHLLEDGTWAVCRECTEFD